jgi:hypothetical protein
MKRLVLAALAAAGIAVARKVQQGRTEQELWREATDPIGPRPGQ